MLATLMRVTKTRLLLVSVSCLLLAGCPSLKLAPLRPEQAQFKHMDFKERESRLKTIQQWELSGAILIKYYDTKKQQRVSQIAYYSWYQKKPHKQFYLSLKASALGLASARIFGNQDSATLVEGKEQIKNKNVDALVAQIGFPLPVSNSYYWIRGIPVTTGPANPNPSIPGLSQAKYDQWGHLISGQQGQWSLRFSKFEHDTKNNMDFPRLINLEWRNPDPQKQNTNLTIRIAIKQRHMSP